MAFGFETWSKVGCNGSRVGHGVQRLGGVVILGFLILMTQGSSNGLGKMFGNEVPSETWKGCEMVLTDGPETGGRNGSKESTMVILRQFTFGFVGAKYPIGLMGRGSLDWKGPESIVLTNTCDDDGVVFQNLDVVFGKKGKTIIITEWLITNLLYHCH